jgi:hypothetical protein
MIGGYSAYDSRDNRVEGDTMIYDERLARALNFTEEDLAANRERQMTVMQIAKLHEHMKSETRWGLFGTVFIPAVIFFLGISISVERGYTDFCSGFFYLFAILVAIGVFSLTMSTRRQYLKELNEKQVKSVQGRAHSWRTRSNDSVLWIYTDNESLGFHLNKDASHEFERDEYYRVYFIETGHFLLSVERVKVKS